MDAMAQHQADLESAIDTDDVSKLERSFDRLQRMGVVAWEQVLLLLPSSYKDYTEIKPFLPANEALYPVPKACYEVTVTSNPNKAGVSPPRVSFNVTDSCNTARVTVFGDIWAWMQLVPDQTVIIEGVVDVWEGNLQINNPVLVRKSFAGKAIPMYRGKRGKNRAATISPEFVFEKTREALDTHLEATASYLLGHFPGMDEEFLIRRSAIPYPTLVDLLKDIHAPTSIEASKKGQLAARALAAFEVIFNAESQMVKKPNPKSVINVKQGEIDALIARFPHPLTEHQLLGVKDIVDDLRKPYAMNRLISGDVGFGKTDTILIPAIAAQRAGAKVAVLCPSKIIADQWFEKIKGYGKNNAAYVVAAGQKGEISLEGNPILVGTTALLTKLPTLKSAGKDGWVPDFLVIDEQQKHGKVQKEVLLGSATNRLEATATCQPKTAALVNYGGMDETILNQCPVVKKIHTRIVSLDERARLFAHMKRVLDEVPNSQFAIVYPKVTAGDDRSSLISSSAMWERLFPGQIGILHGGMSADEKSNVITKMHRNEIRILLSSVLIETGITLPSLRGLVVIGADCFGVSALHQLRGRLARHGGTGYFYMFLTDGEVQEETMQRLELLVAHNDGFVLAEKDAEMRGFGSMGEEDEGQSGFSRSQMFAGLRLMPKDIERAIASKS